MDLKHLKCPACGGTDKLEKKIEGGEELWRCAYCGCSFVETSARREYEKLEAKLKNEIKSDLDSAIARALLRKKTETYYNLRSQLWSKITANYIDSNAIINISREILAIAPHDFLAEFFEVANSGNDAQVAEYICNIDVTENAIFIDLVLDFLIRSLKEKYITPTAALLERSSKIFSPEKKQLYLTRFENEAKKVKEGLYDLDITRDVFLAYSSKDMPAVIEILELIESEGLTCFAAFRNLQHGRDAIANYERALEKAIDNCNIFLFISSENSRSTNCDAYRREISYIKNKEMNQHPEYKTYDQLPDKYRKLRIEYRLDNKPTRLVERDLKSFFAGLTYAEDHDQLIDRLSDCIDQLNGEGKPDEGSLLSEDEIRQFEKEKAKLVAEKELWENKKAAEEAKKQAEEEAARRAASEEKRKADAKKLQKKQENKEKRKENFAKTVEKSINGIHSFGQWIIKPWSWLCITPILLALTVLIIRLAAHQFYFPNAFMIVIYSVCALWALIGTLISFFKEDAPWSQLLGHFAFIIFILALFFGNIIPTKWCFIPTAVSLLIALGLFVLLYDRNSDHSGDYNTPMFWNICIFALAATIITVGKICGTFDFCLPTITSGRTVFDLAISCIPFAVADITLLVITISTALDNDYNSILACFATLLFVAATLFVGFLPLAFTIIFFVLSCIVSVCGIVGIFVVING